ncbi:hypothetical protein BOX15_Mlig020463g1, partial [Macrostomum lignano]|uniref:pyridoxal 5'-phosphate synthase n=2 Tax=Macrostomum lignano TaxID=282301 RepID=A0A1I8JD92_9PLAT
PCTRPIRGPADALARGFSRPFSLFRCWQRDAIRSGLCGQANTMVLASACAKTLKPSQRPMQLADANEDAFLFLSSECSRKGCQIAQNNRVSLFFDWLAQGRHVTVEGEVAIVRDKQQICRYFSQTFTPDLCRYFYAIDSNQSLAIDDEFKEQFQQEVDALIRGGDSKGPPPPPPSMVLFCVEATGYEFCENSNEIGNVRLVYSRCTEDSQVDNRFTFSECPDWVVEQIAQ